MKIDRFSFPLKTHKLCEPGEPFEVSVPIPIAPTESVEFSYLPIKVLEHGVTHGKFIKVTCSVCECIYAIPLSYPQTFKAVNQEDGNKFIIKTECPECDFKSEKLLTKEELKDLIIESVEEE